MVLDNYQEVEFFCFGLGYFLCDLLMYVNFDYNDYWKKIIFIGDIVQLLFVGMLILLVFSLGYLW